MIWLEGLVNWQLIEYNNHRRNVFGVSGTAGPVTPATPVSWEGRDCPELWHWVTEVQHVFGSIDDGHCPNKQEMFFPQHADDSESMVVYFRFSNATSIRPSTKEMPCW